MASPRVRRITFKGSVSSRDEAVPLMAQSGDAVLVKRGVARSLVLRCPCGCGDDLILNLDKRTGPAWRLYQKKGGITLYPSYWRDSECGSHFILWKDRVVWCDTWEDEDQIAASEALEHLVIEALSPEEFVSYDELAERIGEIPWEVLTACRRLVRRGSAEEAASKPRGRFRRMRENG